MSRQKVKLGEVCKFLNGGTPRRDVAHYFTGNNPWITSADINEDEVYVEKARFYITEEAIENSATKLVPQGNILLVSRTGVGKVAINKVDVCISQDFTGILPNQKLLDVKFLYWYLKQSKSYFSRHQRGATIQGITREIIENLELPLPPLPDQEHIARVLDEVDGLRRKRRETIAKLEELTESIFLETLGDIYNPDPSITYGLFDLLEILPQNGAYLPKEDYSDNGVEMVHMSDMFNSIVTIGNLKRVRADQKIITKYSLSTKDILIARRSLNYEGAAKPCLVPESHDPLLFESSLIRIRPNTKMITKLFLFHYLSNRIVRERYVYPYITRSTISGINQQGLKMITVILPDIDKQIDFDKKTIEINQMRQKHIYELQQLDDLFTSLQSQFFSDTPSAVSPVVTPTVKSPPEKELETLQTPVQGRLF